MRAIKIIHRSRFSDARPYEREFTGIQKYEPLSRSSEGLVDVLQIGRNDLAGYFYYVMELADDAGAGAGDYVPKTLAREIRARGRLSVEECVTLGVTLNLALGQMHSQGLIHRDVKPSNIIFVNGVPKLADVGLVSAMEEAHSFVGTEGFVPPEGPNSPQADLFALGKTLYEASMAKDRHEFPEPYTHLGTGAEFKSLMELNEVLLKACAPDPRDRYRTAGEMNADLALLLGGQSVRQKYAQTRRLKMMTRVALAITTLMVLGVVPYGLALREAAVASRAEAAEREELYHSYLAQIRAGRFSHDAGQRRFAGLELVQKALKIRPSLELRNEAIACLATPDVRLVQGRDARGCIAAVGFTNNIPFYEVADTQGNVSVRNYGTGQVLVTLPGKGWPVADLVGSEDGRLLSVAARDARSGNWQAGIWDLSRAPVCFDPAITNWRTGAFTLDNKLIAIARKGTDEEPATLVEIYELASHHKLRTIPLEDLPWAIAFDPQGRTLAVSSDRSTNVLLFDVETGQSLSVLPHPSIVRGVCFDPEGKILATSGNDQRIYLWDTGTTNVMAVLAGHNSAVIHTVFSHNGRMLASTSWDGNIKLWSMATLKELCSAPMEGSRVSFSPDDRWLANDYGNPQLFEVNSGDELKLLRNRNGDSRTAEACGFSPDGRFLALADNAGVCLWEVRTGKEIAFLPIRGANAAIFHPAANLLLTGGDTGVQAWPFERAGPDSGAVTFGSPMQLGQPAAFTKASLDREGKKLVLVCNGRLCVLSLQTGSDRVIAGAAVADSRIQTRGPLQTFAEGASPGTVIYRSACLSPDGKWCAANCFNTNVVQVFDTETAQALQTLEVPDVRNLAFSPDGQWLVTCAINEYRFWNTSTWQCVRTIASFTSSGLYGDIAFSQDSAVAAVFGKGQTIRLINPASGQELATLQPYESQNNGLFDLSRDGAHLAMYSGNYPAQLWDLRLVRKELARMNLDWSAPSPPDLAGKK
jgi:WD40 repeat protein